jgi:hypothetical protein
VVADERASAVVMEQVRREHGRIGRTARWLGLILCGCVSPETDKEDSKCGRIL